MNSKILPLLASAIALSITSAFPVLSQSTAPTTPPQRNQMRRPNFLNLTPEQQARMEQIRQNQRSQIDALLTAEQNAIICALPLLLTVVTGITFPIAKALHQRQLAGFLIHLHTLETIGLDGFFPIINGLGLLGLIVTGIYMTSAASQLEIRVVSF